jgi:hypothetical protein
LEHADELIEEVPAIMWAGGRLGVILNGKCRFIFQSDTLYRFIIKIDMGDLGIRGCPDGCRINTESMILRSDLAISGHEIFDGMVKSSVTMVHLEGGNTIGKCQQLMSEADPEKRLACLKDILYGFHCIVHGTGVTRAVRYEKAMRVEFL